MLIGHQQSWGHKMSERYQGKIVDRMNNDEIMAKTRFCPTWDAAQNAAETLAKRKGFYESARFAITTNLINDGTLKDLNA